MQNVQTPTANRRRVLRCEALCLRDQPFPQIWHWHQQSRGEILLHVLPRRLCFCGCQALLEYREAQRISEFDAVDAGEINGSGIGLPPRIRLGRFPSEM